MGYVKALSQYSTQIGEPCIKHLDGDIWKLRSIRDRILFVAWLDGNYILLHHFMKKHLQEKSSRRNEN